MSDASLRLFNFREDIYEDESCSSVGADEILYPCIQCPSILSCSLESIPNTNTDTEEIRLFKLNEILKKFIDLLNDPIKREDVTDICRLSSEFFQFNGEDGYYVRYLPRIDDIIEFMCLRVKQMEQLLCHIEQYCHLCSKPFILGFPKDISDLISIEHHYSLMGYLLILAPSENVFFMVANAIKIQFSKKTNKSKFTKDIISLEEMLGALIRSKFLLTFTNIMATCSMKVYQKCLEIAAVLTSISNELCFRILESGVENVLLIRIYQCKACSKGNCLDSSLDDEEYYKIVEYSSKILWRLMVVSLRSRPKDSGKTVDPPTDTAMRCLRCALRREISRASKHNRSRKLRNDLASLILAGQLREGPLAWQILNCGIAEDLTDLLTLSEYPESNKKWLKTVKVETHDWTALEFKKILFLAVVICIQKYNDDARKLLQNRKIIICLLELIDLGAIVDSKDLKEVNNLTVRVPWNAEKLWHLFKYALNALSYIACILPEEFLANSGSVRLIQILERFLTIHGDEILLMYLSETICSLVSSMCQIIVNDFKKNDLISIFSQLIQQILNTEALTSRYQLIMTYALMSCETLLDKCSCSQDFRCNTMVNIALTLLKRYLHPKNEDSKLEPKFQIAISTYIWKLLVTSLRAFEDFSVQGGLYLILDVMTEATLPVQNAFLGVLTDLYENEYSKYCIYTWRSVNDKTSILSLLPKIWRKEETILDIQRINKCSNDEIGKDLALMKNDHWLYFNFIKIPRNSRKVTTTVVGPAGPKIYYLYKNIKQDTGKIVHTKTQKTHYEFLLDRVSSEDRAILPIIETYDLVRDEDSIKEIFHLLDQFKVQPLKESQKPLFSVKEKLEECKRLPEQLLSMTLVRRSPLIAILVFDLIFVTAAHSGKWLTTQFLVFDKKSHNPTRCIMLQLTNTNFYRYDVNKATQVHEHVYDFELDEPIAVDRRKRSPLPPQPPIQGSQASKPSAPELVISNKTDTPANVSYSTSEPTVVVAQAATVSPIIGLNRTTVKPIGNGKAPTVSIPIVPSQNPTANVNRTSLDKDLSKVHVWANQTRWANVTDKVVETTTSNSSSSNSDADLDFAINKYPAEVTNQTLRENNILKSENDTHQYYNSSFSVDEATGKGFWVDLENHPDLQVNSLLSKSHRRAATIKLKFDFPFYGHKVRNITIATGGFLYTGEYVHSWLAATQYIAPLMANFDTTLSSKSFVKYADNGTAFTVEWENVQLQDKPEAGAFTFQVTLLQNGDIVFVYKAIPLLVENIEDKEHPVKIGLSDAYMMDRTVFFARRKTIYEYHRVTFNRQDIKNWTAIYLKALPTCLQMDNCNDCLTKVPDFDCKWCPELQKCSTGTFRFRQDWLQKNCDTKNIREEAKCPARSAGTSYREHAQEARIENHRTEDGSIVAKFNPNQAAVASSSIEHCEYLIVVFSSSRLGVVDRRRNKKINTIACDLQLKKI
uniref:Cilia- and flagella-associated protein 69 ARM repeats domain-containing protein n=1 Tax=Trichogramma kaykai TaxID=54128 RepID=A0ABD2X819_9HYME